MHGRPRSQKHKVHGEAERKRAALYASLVREALGRFRRWTAGADGREGEDEELMRMAAAVIEVNPECYSMWSVRKTVTLARLDRGAGGAAEAAARAELELSERGLRRNVKSYSAWYHRKWVIAEPRLAPQVSLPTELALVDKLLAVDSRNFHAWGYRRFVAQRLGRSVGDELEYSMRQIERNFSNYSAWHYRSVLMAAGAAVGGEDGGVGAGAAAGANVRLSSFSSSMAVPLAADVLRREFSLVQQALYTEPSDQSGWFYQNWLQGCCLLADADAADGRRALLSAEADACREIIQEERESAARGGGAGGAPSPAAIKWPTLALARLVDVGAEARDGETPEALYAELRAADAQRAGMYDALLRARRRAAAAVAR